MAAATFFYCPHCASTRDTSVIPPIDRIVDNNCNHTWTPQAHQQGVFIPADAKVKIGSHAASRATDGTIEKVAEYWQFTVEDVTEQKSNLVVGNSFQNFHWQNMSEPSHQRVCEVAWDGVLGNVQGCVMYGTNKFVGNQDNIDQKERQTHDAQAESLGAMLTVPQAQDAYNKFKLWGSTSANPDMIFCSSDNNNANFSGQSAIRRMKGVIDWKKRTQPRKNTNHRQGRMQLVMADMRWNECGGIGNNNNNGPIVFHTTMIDNNDQQAVTHAYYFANENNGIVLKSVHISCDLMIYWIKRLFGAQIDNRYPDLPARVSGAFAVLHSENLLKENEFVINSNLVDLMTHEERCQLYLNSFMRAISSSQV